ncbi:MAG: hypothetical protein ACR2QK_18430 [Acidimicrobiales bacterium]
MTAGVEAAQSRTSRWWFKPVIGLVALAVILLSGPIYGRLTAGGKIDDEIDRSAAQVDVTVDLPFAPENYHRETLSELGVFAGRDRSDETKLRLRAVSQSDLDKIANLYWVEAVLPSER